MGGCISPSRDNHQLESRMREIRQSGSEGGEAEINRPSLPLSSSEDTMKSPGRCVKLEVLPFAFTQGAYHDNGPER
jgi:hypothetical protein